MSGIELALGKDKVFERPEWMSKNLPPIQREENKASSGCATSHELPPAVGGSHSKNGKTPQELFTGAPIEILPSCDDVAKVRTKLLMDSDMISPFDKDKDNKLTKQEITDALGGSHSIEQKAGLKMLADNFHDIAGIGGRSKYLQAENISEADIKLLARAALNRIEMASDPQRARQLQLEDLKSHVFPSKTEVLLKGVFFTALGAGIGYLCGGWKFAIVNGLSSSGFVLGSRHVEDRMAVNSRMERLDNKILPNWSRKVGSLTAKDFSEK